MIAAAETGYTLVQRTYTEIKSAGPQTEYKDCSACKIPCPVDAFLTALNQKKGQNGLPSEAEIRASAEGLALFVLKSRVQVQSNKFVPGIRVNCKIRPEEALSGLPVKRGVTDTITRHGGLVFQATDSARDR